METPPLGIQLSAVGIGPISGKRFLLGITQNDEPKFLRKRMLTKLFGPDCGQRNLQAYRVPAQGVEESQT